MRDPTLPPLLPGETLYSLCARVGHLDPRTATAASQWLLGHTRGSAQHELPFGLAQLERHYGGPLGELPINEKTVRVASVLGAAMPFFTPKHRQEVVRALRAVSATYAVRRKLGLRYGAGSIGLVLRRCPDCAAADVAQFGLTYWHTAHQFAGVWACPWHCCPLQWLAPAVSKTMVWTVAHRPGADFQNLRVTDSELRLLLNVSAVVLWCSSWASLGRTALAIMARRRLHACGLVRRENILTAEEQMAAHESTAGPLARRAVPHFISISTPDWVGKTLTFTEYSHPFRWAVLLSSTLHSASDCLSARLPVEPTASKNGPAELSGRIDMGAPLPLCLDEDLTRARLRVPQMELFADRRGPRIHNAADEVFRALSRGGRLASAATELGLPRARIQSMIRKDKALAAHWHSCIATQRIEDARIQIEGYLRAHPDALRSNVLREQLAAARSLQRYAPDLLEELLPRSDPKWTGQRALPL